MDRPSMMCGLAEFEPSGVAYSLATNATYRQTDAQSELQSSIGCRGPAAFADFWKNEVGTLNGNEWK
jgi:hypothetical protein